jgi:hypothetical protein
MAKQLTKILDFPEEFRERVPNEFKEHKRALEKEQKAYDRKLQKTLNEVRRIEGQARDYTVLEFLERMGRLELFRLHATYRKAYAGGGKNILYSLIGTIKDEGTVTEVKHDWVGSSLENLKRVNEDHLRDFYWIEEHLDEFYSHLKNVDLVEKIMGHHLYTKG